MQRGLTSSETQFGSIGSISQLQPPFPLRLGSRAIAPPIAADGLIIVPLYEGAVVLLSEFGGAERGRIRVSGRIETSPALANGILFVAASNNICAFDLVPVLDHRSGKAQKPEWVFNCETGLITQPLLVSQQTVYAIAQAGDQWALYALSQNAGQRLWSTPLKKGRSPVGPPALIGQRLVVFSASGFSIFDPHEGHLLGEYSLNLELDPQVQPFVAEERAVLVDRAGSIFELKVNQQGPLMSQLFGGRARILSLAVSEDYIAAGHTSGLMLMNSRGHVIWSNADMEPVSVAPLIASDSVFALDDRGNALLFDTLRSNPVVKTKMLSGEVCTQPLMTRSTVAAVSSEGEVSALKWR